MSMKLNDYMNLVNEEQFTCWDDIVDSEFYFFKEDEDYEIDPDFPNVDNLMTYLKENLDIKEIRQDGVVVGLYELLNNPIVIQYAKDNIYKGYHYDSDEDIVMALFEKMESNLSNGLERFSGQMLEAFKLADEAGKELDVVKEDTSKTTLYILNRFSNMDDYSDRDGEYAPDYREVFGIYESYKQAVDMKEHFEQEDAKDVEQFETDPHWFEISTYEIERENENLKEVVILSCTHEHKYGVDAHSSIHASSEEALAYVDTVMSTCGYEGGKYGEYFNYDIETTVIDVNKLKTPGQELSHATEKAQEENKIKIDLGFTTLVAEIGSDPNYKEIFIGLEDKDGGFVQDLAVIGGKYDYDKNGEVVYDGNLSLKIYADKNSEDYTHDFTVGVYDYEEEKEVSHPSLDKKIESANLRSADSSFNKTNDKNREFEK